MPYDTEKPSFFQKKSSDLYPLSRGIHVFAGIRKAIIARKVNRTIKEHHGRKWIVVDRTSVLQLSSLDKAHIYFTKVIS